MKTSTDREPLRVGPLVLSALRTGGTFESCELWAGMALIRAGLCVEVPHERTSKEVGSVPPFGALKLTQAGKLVADQYRSRRRLLARECIDRADYLDALAFGFSGDLGVKRRRNAAKLRALAERLRA